MKTKFLFLMIISASLCFSVDAQVVKSRQQGNVINSQESGVKTENEDIKKVLDLYVVGLQKGDVGLLDRAFFSDGQFCVLSGENEVTCQKFGEVLGGWVKSPDLSASGTVLSRELQGPMAKVTFRLNFGGREYIDYLTMYKAKSGWTIVAKTTWIQK